MPIANHPDRGTIVTVDFNEGFKNPEMAKKRLVVVLTPKIRARPRLMTVVPLSMTPPDPVMPYHKPIQIPFDLPASWGNYERWIKGDMVNAVGFHRVDFLTLGKDRTGQKIYQKKVLPDDLMKIVQRCVLHGMGMSALTKSL